MLPSKDEFSPRAQSSAKAWGQGLPADDLQAATQHLGLILNEQARRLSVGAAMCPEGYPILPCGIHSVDRRHSGLRCLLQAQFVPRVRVPGAKNALSFKCLYGKSRS